MDNSKKQIFKIDDPYNFLNSSSNIDEILIYVKEKILTICTQMKKSKMDKKQTERDKITEYIENNYKNPLLDINTISRGNDNERSK